MRSLTLFLVVALSTAGTAASSATTAGLPTATSFVVSDSLCWPGSTEVLHFENLDGIILRDATLRGRAGADTTGPFALDTGAGYLAIDLDLARRLGLEDTASTTEAVDIAEYALPRLTVGNWMMDQVEPVLTVNAEILRRVCDRPVLGLLGHKLMRDRALWIDYREQVIAFIPVAPYVDLSVPRVEEVDDRSVESGPTSGSASTDARGDAMLKRSRELLSCVLTPKAFALRFRLVGDGKILVHGTISDPRPPHFSKRLNFLIDTGATKCVLFEDALAPSLLHADAWPALRGFTAPTLIGAADARIARIPVIQLEAEGGPLSLAGVDAGLLTSDLGRILSRVTHETIHGLIGYSLLKRFRVVVDYPDGVLWLDPIRLYRDDRPLEYCHVGVQLERVAGAVIVTGVAIDSPAAQAGILRGDEVMALDGNEARTLDLITLAHRMEGEPGRKLTLVIRRDSVEHTYKLARRRLL